MINNIRSLESYAIEFEEELKERGFTSSYRVENIWIDYGANWRDDTIVVYFVEKDGSVGSFQILSPRDLREIKEGTFSEHNYYRLLDKHTEMFEKYNWGKEEIPVGGND